MIFRNGRVILLTFVGLILLIYLICRFIDPEKLHFILFMFIILGGLILILFVGILELFNPELSYQILNLIVQ